VHTPPQPRRPSRYVLKPSYISGDTGATTSALLAASADLLTGRAREESRNPAPSALLTWRPAGNRKSDPRPSAGIKNSEWHGQPSAGLFRTCLLVPPSTFPSRVHTACPICRPMAVSAETQEHSYLQGGPVMRLEGSSELTRGALSVAVPMNDRIRLQCGSSAKFSFVPNLDVTVRRKLLLDTRQELSRDSPRAPWAREKGRTRMRLRVAA
jgi:hypothetical protein